LGHRLYLWLTVRQTKSTIGKIAKEAEIHEKTCLMRFRGENTGLDRENK
jgi:hypothetical protein